MPRILDVETVANVQRKALANGGSVRQFAVASNGNHHTRTVEWDVAGNCLSPITVELHGRPRAPIGVKHMMLNRDGSPRFVCMQVACRKCANCLRRRGYMWSMRARAEWGQSNRTWLATLTLSPTSLTVLLSRARVRLGRGGTDYDALAGPDQFLELEKEGFREIQKYLKRLRKNSGKAIRYLCITESHKSGVPHWHLLLHEPDQPLSYDKDLKGSWNLGFDSYKLVRDARAAGYVTKYLSKAVEARVRASSGYGGALAPTLPANPECERQAENEVERNGESDASLEREKSLPETRRREKSNF